MGNFSCLSKTTIDDSNTLDSISYYKQILKI